MTYPTIEIYKRLYSSHQRCKERLNALGIELINNQGQTLISKNDYLVLLHDRYENTRNNTARNEAAMRLNEFGVKITSTKDTSSSERKSIKAKNKRTSKKSTWHRLLLDHTLTFIETLSSFFSARPMIFATLMMALCIQIHHLANLVNSVSKSDGLLLGYIFGTVAEMTALMLTVHKAKKWFLLLFAFIQFWINILYYCVPSQLITKVTLSALIAFVIYSYSELYSSKQ